MIDKKFVGERIIIKEKIEAPIVMVDRKQDSLFFYKKHKKKITLLDKVLTKIYDEPIKYLIRNKKYINEDAIYKFNYVYDEKPASIVYNLEEMFILSDVISKNNYLIKSDYFFEQENIIDTVITEDILKNLNNISHYSFDTFVKNLNSGYKSNTGNTVCNSVSVIILNNDKILKKYSHNFNKKSPKRYTNDKNIIIVKEMIDFLSTVNLTNVYFKKRKFYYRNYIELIYELYCLFEVKHLSISVEKPDFMKNPIFSLNKRYLDELIIKNEDLFKLFLNIFRKEKRFNNLMVNESDFKKYQIIIYNINKKLKEETTQEEFVTFNDFIKNINV